MKNIDLKSKVLEELIKLFKIHGFITTNDIFDITENANLSLEDVDKICDELFSKGIIVKDSDETYDNGQMYLNFDYSKINKQ